MTLNRNKIKSEHKKLGEKSGPFKFLKLEEGPNRLRILPPPDGSDEFWVEYEQSFNVGPNKKTVIPRGQFGLDCPLAKHREYLYAQGDERSKKLANAMNPKTRISMWVINRDDEESGPVLFSTNQNVFRDILAVILDPEYDDITDPETGTDITINYTPGDKTDTGFPKWQVLPKRNSSPLSKDADKLIAWTKENLFEKYKIGHPSEAEYIIAMIKGETYSSSSSEDSEKLEKPEIYVKGDSDEDEEEQETPFDGPGEEIYWISLDEDVVEMKASDIQELVQEQGDDIPIMTLDQSSGWKEAKDFGFIREVKKPSSQPPNPKKTDPPKKPGRPAKSKGKKVAEELEKALKSKK